jgi:hypothetical protein
VSGTDITVWTISALLAIGVGWSRYAKMKTRDKLVRELAVMEPDRREKILIRLNPKLAMEIRQALMERFRMKSDL